MFVINYCGCGDLWVWDESQSGLGTIVMDSSQEGCRQERVVRDCDAFLDRFYAMMNHEKVEAFLADQEHMLVTSLQSLLPVQ